MRPPYLEEVKALCEAALGEGYKVSVLREAARPSTMIEIRKNGSDEIGYALVEDYVYREGSKEKAMKDLIRIVFGAADMMDKKR